MIFGVAAGERGYCNPESTQTFTTDAGRPQVAEKRIAIRRRLACDEETRENIWRLLPQAGEVRQCMRIRETGKGQFLPEERRRTEANPNGRVSPLSPDIDIYRTGTPGYRLPLSAAFSHQATHPKRIVRFVLSAANASQQ